MIRVGIVGATGYTGEELMRILANHPEAEVRYITSESQTGTEITKVYGHLHKYYDGVQLKSLQDLTEIAENTDVIFIGLPHGHAMAIGKQLESYDVKIIDLGGDYRFYDTAVYEKWYNVEHTHKDAKAVYGLAEWYRDRIRDAKIVGNAGCYTTASILALAPLAKAGLINTKSIVIDAKSGMSGAGRGLKLSSHFTEMYDNFTIYGVTNHRHTPEIEQALTEFAGEDVIVNFTPHLLPISRGILSTCYADLKEGVTAEDVDKAFAECYADEHFIRLLGRGACPMVKKVRGSNFCDLGWHIDPRTGRVIVVSAIDNLVKGAAGQAVQNMNIVFGLDESCGLQQVPLYP